LRQPALRAFYHRVISCRTVCPQRKPFVIVDGGNVSPDHDNAIELRDYPARRALSAPPERPNPMSENG
jgi:hypothetical protein